MYRRNLPGYWRENSDDLVDAESYQGNLSYNRPKPVEEMEIPATHSCGDELAYSSEIDSMIPVQSTIWTTSKIRTNTSVYNTD